MDFLHGIARLKDNRLEWLGKEGDYFIITARLPEEQIFAISYGRQLIRFDWTEEQFKIYFDIYENFFISDGTWFDKDSICLRLIETIDRDGLFVGPRNGELDEEMCSITEFKEMKSGY